MTNSPMISPLSELELDAVTGGTNGGGGFRLKVYQNARGGDAVAVSGRGGDANAGGVLSAFNFAKGGDSGLALAIGGNGGTIRNF